MATKTKKTETKKQTKTTKPAKAKAATKKATGKMSQVDAALKVLAEARKPMNCKAMVEAMGTKGYWTSPGGKTPAATLYAAILKDITTKGKDARFKHYEASPTPKTNRQGAGNTTAVLTIHHPCLRRAINGYSKF